MKPNLNNFANIGIDWSAKNCCLQDDVNSRRIGVWIIKFDDADLPLQFESVGWMRVTAHAPGIPGLCNAHMSRLLQAMIRFRPARHQHILKSSTAIFSILPTEQNGPLQTPAFRLQDWMFVTCVCNFYNRKYRNALGRNLVLWPLPVDARPGSQGWCGASVEAQRVSASPSYA